MLPPLSRTSLVEMLTSARQQNSLSIRRAAALANVPPSTAQGWFEGRHLPTPALMPHFVELLESLKLVESDDDRSAWKDAVARMRNATPIEASPYVGLRPYTAAESQLFVGRERAYRSLVDACLLAAPECGPRTVVVVGDSGAGKSSLLAAGLVGRACSLLGPLSHLNPVLLEVHDLPGFVVPAEPTLLVIDQFEDAERLDPDAQAAVFDALASLPTHVTCVVGLAASAFGFALRDERFATHLTSAVLVGSLTPEEYTRIIEEPAQMHGRRVTPGLTQLLLRDMRQYGDPTPGTILPLLSNALRRCWVEAPGDLLTTVEYLATGGLWSALNTEAEAVFSSFTTDQQDLVRRLMLSLLQVDGVHILRSRIREASLQPEMAPIVDSFMASRLLTRKDGQLAISHDALLTRWKRLSEWVEREKTSLLIGRRIHMAAQLWQDGGRTTDALMPVEAVLWKQWAESDSATLLSDWEHEFIDASLGQAEATQVEQRRTLTRMRRRQYIAITAALVAIAMMASTAFATVRAEGFRRDAEAATLSAQARQIALIADEIRPIAPNVAGQLSVAALSLDESTQSRSAVVESSGTGLPTRATGRAGNTMVASSRDGTAIVRAGSDGIISVWQENLLSSSPTTVESGGNQLFALSMAYVGERLLAFVGGQQTAGIWDLTDEPTKLADFGTDTVTYSAAWNGTTVHFGTLDGVVRSIDCSDLDHLVALPELTIGEETAVTGLASSEEWILAGGRKDRVEVFTADGEARERLTITGTALSIDSSPDGGEFLVGSAQNNATVWRPGGAGLELAQTIATPSSVNAVRHTGERRLIAGAFGEVREYADDWTETSIFPGRTVVTSIDASPQATIAGSIEGDTVLWPASTNTSVFTAPDGVELYDVIRTRDTLLVGTSAGAELFTEQGDAWERVIVTPPPSSTNYTAYYGISDDGAVLVNQTSEGALITLARTADGYRAVDTMTLPASMVDIRVSSTGKYFSVGYRGKVGYTLFAREGSGWTELVTVDDAWPAGCAFSPDESLFVAVEVEGKGFVVWDLSDEGSGPRGKVTMSKEVTPTSFAFSPTGQLAVGDTLGQITLYDMLDPAAPNAVHHLRDARSSLSQVRFSADGAMLHAATREGHLWVWRATGETPELDLQLSPVSAAVQGADSFGDWFIMSLDNGRTVAWTGDPSAAAADLCSRFGDRLDQEEWSRLVPGVKFTNGC